MALNDYEHVSSNKTFKCYLCPKKFEKVSAIDSHNRQCHRRLKQNCPICRTVFLNNALVAAHQAAVAPPPPPPPQ